jgi:UDP-glucose 4-epimerase
MTTRAWVVGASGLLGSTTVHATLRRDGWSVLDVPPMPWHDRAALAGRAAGAARQLVADLDPATDDWAMLWLGGAGVTSSPEAQLRLELEQLQLVLDQLPVVTAGGVQGGIFYASSAGGVYGGSAAPPFTEHTEPRPLGAYGRSKLEAEQIVRRTAERLGVASLVGRISNLYGPGQKLAKMQGIISHLARAQFSPAPASVYVPLDTMRDYLFVEDAAELVLDAMDELRARGGHHTKILASQASATIGELLGQFHALLKARPHVMLGQSDQAANQAIDLRLRSVVWPHLDVRDLTPLPVGVHRTMQAVLGELVTSTTAPAARP